jgi:uncharacterized Ntn-hydrolase superfamily protein
MTFSLIALDSQRRFMVVATATKTEAVGASVPAIKPGVGGVVSQSFTNPELRALALSALSEGAEPALAIQQALATDSSPELRQLAVLNGDGTAAFHSGSGCSEVVGAFATHNFVAIGNLLKSDDVIAEMARAWSNPEGLVPLINSALSCMSAGELAGGDSRGRQSAALLIADMVDQELLADLRVDDHAEPLGQLGLAAEQWALTRAPSA